MSRNFNQWKEMLGSKEKLIEKLSGDISICDWGSCQYNSANNIFKLYFKLKESKLTFKEIQELLYFEFKYDKILDFNKIKKDLLEDYFFEDLRSSLEYKNNVGEIEYSLKFNLKLINAKSIDEIFIIVRENSYDLWSAIDVIFLYCFGYDSYKNFNILIKSKGYGPPLNQEFQSQNFDTGIKAAILVDLGLIKDHSVFKNFDT